MQDANKLIEDRCNNIRDMIAAGKKHAKILSAELDDINDITIPSIKDKFKKKNEKIDKCDEAFDELMGIMQDEETQINKEIAEAQSLVHRLRDELTKTND